MYFLLGDVVTKRGEHILHAVIGALIEKASRATNDKT